MTRERSILERQLDQVELRPFTLEGFHRRRERKQRNRRIAAGVVGLMVAVAGAGGLVGAFSPGTVPAGDPRSPFLDTWSATDADRSLQTMTIRASGEDAVEIVVRDDSASVCSGAPSTMTGNGSLVRATELVIASSVLTCDDGSKPRALSGPPMHEQLRNVTFVHDPETDTLTDNFGSVWQRDEGQDPGPEPTISDSMWPQSTLEDVRQAQELADAGDPRYTWQVDPDLASVDPWTYLADQGPAEIIARFLRERLGWEGFRLNPLQGEDDAGGSADGTFGNLEYIRCAPGETNPLYPDDADGSACAPTIDELQYETVSLDLAQVGRRGPSGIWVVSRWAAIAPFAQVEPPVAEATALLEDFLQARVEGEDAKGYVEIVQGWSMTEGVPLLYATTTGAPYERSGFEMVSGPAWPFGDMEFNVRLFADGGETMVEQRFSLRHRAGRLWLEYRPTNTGVAPTTENGDPVAVPYGYFDGEVTVHAADPWAESFALDPGLVLDQQLEERLELVGDPLPVETGCEPGSAAADADALAQSIGSDPDFEATAPVAVSVGGIEALRMDVTSAPGASVCEAYPAPMVLKPDDDDSWRGLALEHGSRMRLYLLDVPEGLSIQVLAIAIVAPEARFQRVIEAAAPIVGSFEFHTR